MLKNHKVLGNETNRTKFKKFRPIKSFKECEYKKRTIEKVKITNFFFNIDYIIKNAIYEHGAYNQ